MYCLPLAEVRVGFDTFPIDLNVKDYRGNVESTIRINEASYEFEKGISPQLKITISGEKIYGDDASTYASLCDMISYKLYDSSGKMVYSGIISLMSLSVGDKFKDDSVCIYDISPGETYSFVLLENER